MGVAVDADIERTLEMSPCKRSLDSAMDIVLCYIISSSSRYSIYITPHVSLAQPVII